MEDRQASYFSTDPTPRKDVKSSLRNQSALDNVSRMGDNSRLGPVSAEEGHPRTDVSSRLEQSPVMETNEERMQNGVDVENKVEEKDMPKKPKPKKKKTKPEEVRITQIYRKPRVIKEIKPEESVNLEDFTKKTNMPYPIPKPPPTRKAEIFKIETAREIDKRAQNAYIEIYSDMKALTVRLTDKYYKDVEKVRAIFAWICSLDFTKLDFSLALTEQSPLHVLKELKAGKLSYPDLFTSMCKYVDIPCHSVTGVAKTDKFEIGDTEIDQNKVTWNAVYVADGWRIVFFKWAFETYEESKQLRRHGNQIVDDTPVSSKTGSFKDSLNDGNSTVPRLPAISDASTSLKNNPTDLHNPISHTHVAMNKASENEFILKVNEYYFLTDPDEFIFWCYPDEDMWQLLGKPHSLEKFLKLPILTQSFFEYDLKITSRLSGIRKAKNGTCIISVKRMGSEHVFLNHVLGLVASDDPDEALNYDFKHLVAVTHDIRKTNFHVRFPVAGMYDFMVFAVTSPTDNANGEKLCSFRIRCEEAKVRFEPVPFVPEIGFGPGYLTERFGMKLVSKVNGMVTIRGPDTVDIDFKLKKDIKVTAEMLHPTIPTEDLEGYIELKQHNDDLFITVGVPRNGEYVLKLSAKHRRSNKDFTNVCNFLLMSEDPKKPRKPYETAADLLVRQQLMNTLKTSKNPDEVQHAIDKLNKEDLPDDGWLEKAYERLEYLRLAKALRAGINRKNLVLLEKAIADAKQSSVAEKLENYICEGENIIKDADSNLDNILEMKRTTVSEVHRYKIPKPVMYDVMKATYMLLGERPDSLHTWEEIVYLMRMTSRNSLLYRVKTFHAETVDQSTAEAVDVLLKKHTQEEAALASSGVGTFFLWAQLNVAKLLLKNKPTTPKEEADQSQNGVAVNGILTTEQKPNSKK